MKTINLLTIIILLVFSSCVSEEVIERNRVAQCLIGKHILIDNDTLTIINYHNNGYQLDISNKTIIDIMDIDKFLIDTIHFDFKH